MTNIDVAVSHLDDREKDVLQQGERVTEEINTHAQEMIDHIVRSRIHLSQQVDTIVQQKTHTQSTETTSTQNTHSTQNMSRNNRTQSQRMESATIASRETRNAQRN